MSEIVNIKLGQSLPVEAPAVVRPVGPEDAGLLAELAAAKAKCEMLQTMYESLLSRVIKSA